jgi:hypothetical protein
MEGMSNEKEALSSENSEQNISSREALNSRLHLRIGLSTN